MENHQSCKSRLIIFIAISISFGLVSFASCIVAEIMKNKKKDIKVDGKLCFLPASHAFGLGLGAIICLTAAQVTGNSVFWTNFALEKKRNGYKAQTSIIAKALLFLSWISFVIAMILMSGATSMSKVQPFGRGWLDGDCYLVREGIYTSSAILVLVAVGSTIGSAFATMRKTEVADHLIRVEKSPHNHTWNQTKLSPNSNGKTKHNVLLNSSYPR